MKIIVANWKNYIEDFAQAKKLLEFYKKLSQSKNAFLVVAPPIAYMHSLRALYKGKLLSFASQSLRKSGACTGCVSAGQLKDAKINFALIGHSEQRSRGMSDDDIAEAVFDALEVGVVPILIVGEHKRDESASHYRFVQRQIKSALKKLPRKSSSEMIVAYEPVWAVGAKKSADFREIETMMIYIKKTLVKLLGEKKAKKIPLLYGGSVNHLNIEAILSLQFTDGVLLGRASVDVDEMLKIDKKL